MNYTGRILVILNLIFAVVVGGFLVVDFATRTVWRDAYMKLKAELEVERASAQVQPDSLNKYSADNKKLAAERDSARAELADAQAELKARDANHKLALDAANERVKDADLTLQTKQAENDRLSTENKNLVVAIAKRDKEIVGLVADVNKFRSAAVAEESARKATDARLDQSLTRIAELEKALTKAQSGVAAAEGLPEKGRPNPPSVYVEGKIEAIQAGDATLVQLTVGSDKGLSKNQTLEVFRVDPPTYLGMIRIVDVSPHQAIGRLERTGTVNRAPLRVGDIVASTLSRK